MKTLTLAVLFALGCSTVPDAPPPASCPVVECAWADDGSCPESATYAHESRREDFEGGSCFYFEAVCVPAEIDPACAPESCKRNPFTTCTGY